MMLPEVLQLPSHLLQPPHLSLYQKLAPLSLGPPSSLHRPFFQTQGLSHHIVSATKMLSSNSLLQDSLPKIWASWLLLILFGVCWFGDTCKITFFHVCAFVFVNQFICSHCYLSVIIDKLMFYLQIFFFLAICF